MSFRSVGFCGSGYDACTSQNVPPLSAQMRIEWSGTTVIVGCACTFSRDEYRLLLGLGEPPSLLVTVRKMDGRVGRTSDDATLNWLHASRHSAFAPSELQRVQSKHPRALNNDSKIPFSAALHRGGLKSKMINKLRSDACKRAPGRFSVECTGCVLLPKCY